MKILITGVNGFIGRNLATHLITRGHEVIGLDLDQICMQNNILKYVSGSVLDKKLIFSVTKNVDIVIHLAALTGHLDIVNNKFETLEINLGGTQNVLDAFYKCHQPHKFIYSSTGKVYGGIKETPITEESPTEPLNILGKSKLITERLIDFYADGKKEFIIFRIFQVYGPNQQKKFLIPTIISQLKKSNSRNEIKIMLGDIKSKRDYVYIDDLINAFVKAIDIKQKNGLYTFNICSGRPASAEDIVSIISEILNVSIDIKINEKLFRSDEMSVEYGSHNKARKILGWLPRVTLEQGLRKTIEKT